MILALLCVLVGSACGNDKKSSNKTANTTAGGQSSTGPQTRTVSVDGKTDKYNGAFLAYFPNTVSVRPGDTVDFREVWSGEPHSVTMGQLVEKGLQAAKGASENGPPPPDLAVLPQMLPEGPGDANQGAAQPCFLETGSPPSDATKACPKTAQPPFNGRQPYYSSGFLPDGRNFTVNVAMDTAPGKYQFYCDLHGPEMSGTIEVKPRDAVIPSQEDVNAAARKQLDDTVAKVAPGVQAAKAGQAPFPGNLAGFGAENVPASVNEFIPQTINTKVGQKVTWTFVGAHTISFNAPPGIMPFLMLAPDGSVHIQPRAFAPAGGPGAPAGDQNGPPSTGPPGPPKVVDGGRYDGTGFRSSGLFLSFPPDLLGYSLTFTKAGTYTYLCTLHPGMGGVVQVS
jgi:plastocyanin